jgi:hypothetical protein
MSRANYFYIIAYPEYRGFRIEHDPTFTAYIAAEPSTTNQANAPTNNGIGAIILIAIVFAVILIAVVAVALRRKPKQLLPPPPPP